MTYVGRGVFIRVSDAPTARGGTHRSPILGLPFYLSIYVCTLCRRTAKFDMVTDVGEMGVSWVSHVSHPKRAEFQPLTQNDQIWNDNTYVRRAWF